MNETFVQVPGGRVYCKTIGERAPGQGAPGDDLPCFGNRPDGFAFFSEAGMLSSNTTFFRHGTAMRSHKHCKNNRPAKGAVM